MLTTADRIVLALALIALPMVYFYAWSRTVHADTVEVRAGERVLRYPLGAARDVAIEGRMGTSQLRIEAGRVRFTDSPCPGKLCVLSGWHAHSGELAACLPNGVSVTLLGGHRAYDAVNF